MRYNLSLPFRGTGGLTSFLSNISFSRRHFDYFCRLMNRLIIVLIFLVTTITSFSQTVEKWDLRKCVEYALDHNISIKQQDIQAQIAQLTSKQSDLSKYPNLNFNSNLGLSTGRSIDRTTNQFTTESIFYNSFSLQSNVEVFNWFSKKNTIAGNKYDADAVKALVEKAKNDIALSVAAAYLQILLNKDQVNTTLIKIGQTSAQLENTKKLVKAGSLPELNQLQLESQLATDSFTLISVRGIETQSLLFIKALLNLDAAIPFDITTPPIDLIPIDPIAELQPEYVYQLALKNLPQERINQLRLLAAQKFADAAKGALYPSIGAGVSLGTNYSNLKNNRRVVSTVPNGIDTVAFVSGSNTPVYVPVYDTKYSFYASPYGDQFSNNLSNGIGISISVPIFNGRSARINWQKQKLNVKTLALQRDLDSMSLKQDIYKAYTDAITALQKFNAGTKSVEAAQKEYDFSRKRYDVGLLSTIDLIISQNKLFTTNIEKLSSQYDYVFKMKVLEFYKGQGLKL
jgi:outer membrane protein